MKRFVELALLIILVSLFFMGKCSISNISILPDENSENTGKKLSPPLNGIYHSAFPDFGLSEDDVTKRAVIDFEKLVGKKIVWAYFSNNWYKGIEFPKREVELLHQIGVVPFIRLMPRSSLNIYVEEEEFTLDNIINGIFDEKLGKWAEDAKETGIPILLEFGTEMNGNWFSWSGAQNGGGTLTGYKDPMQPDGPERFKDAYKHIVDIFRRVGATNITWFIHYADYSWPNEPWNKKKNYYPGDEYVDWIGVSVYGPLAPSEKWMEFPDIMNDIYRELASLSSSKPIAVLEFGVMEDYPSKSKAEWIRNALRSLKNGKFPSVKAISYWHSSWKRNDGSIVNLKLDSSPQVLEVYRKEIMSSIFVDRPVFH